MAKLTVLDMVQKIASAMNSDEVNSITDSLEGMQIAEILEDVYFEMMERKNWPHLKHLVTLNASGDVNKPVYLKLPTNTKEIHKVCYDGIKAGETKARIRELTYLTPDEFLIKTNQYNSDSDIVDTITDTSGVKFLIKNNTAPTYYTSFDDVWIVCDSYDSEVESTLQESKTQCWATLSPTFTLSDSFTPDLPVEAFPALLAEAKSVCFTQIKEVADGKSEQQAKRSNSWLSRKAWQAGGGIQLPDYGR